MSEQRYSRFVHLCSTGSLKQMREEALLIKDQEEISTGLYWACYNGSPKKVEFIMSLLTDNNNNTLKHLRTACVPYYDRNLDSHLKTVEILLSNFSFNIPNLDKFIIDITIPCNEPYEYAKYLATLKTLLTEHYYRIDGPGYNQN